MANESHWRATSRRVITEALASGRAAGLTGFAMEKYVSAAYPFHDRSMHPYRVWLNEFALLVRGERKPMATGRMVKPRNPAGTPMFPAGGGPNRVHRLEVFQRSPWPVWFGRLDLGDWLLVVFRAGRLKARTGNTRTGARVGPVVFDEDVCGPKDPPPPASEVAGFLSGLFNFDSIDLAALDGADALAAKEAPLA